MDDGYGGKARCGEHQPQDFKMARRILRRVGLFLASLTVMILVGFLTYVYIVPVVIAIDGDDVMGAADSVTGLIASTNPFSNEDTKDGMRDGDRDGNSSSSSTTGERGQTRQQPQQQHSPTHNIDDDALSTTTTTTTTVAADEDTVAPTPTLAPANAPPTTTTGIPSTYSGMQYSGKVTKVVDGDTLDIGNARIRVVLVDTPERGESGYSEATQFTASKCPVGSTAIYEPDQWQRDGSHGRIVSKVWCFGEPFAVPEISLNEMLLDSGHAETYYYFCDKSEFGDEAWAERHGC